MARPDRVTSTLPRPVPAWIKIGGEGPSADCSGVREAQQGPPRPRSNEDLSSNLRSWAHQYCGVHSRTCCIISLTARTCSRHPSLTGVLATGRTWSTDGVIVFRLPLFFSSVSKRCVYVLSGDCASFGECDFAKWSLRHINNWEGRIEYTCDSYCIVEVA